ncbi:MAG: nucleotidyl transferase AbiEii/AbiGii toxin family protein [Nitrospiria bacterium]
MTPSSPSLYQQLLDVSEFFARHRIEYMLIGGMAVGVWAAPRATADLDFVVGLDEAGLSTLIDAARGDGLVVFDVKPIHFKKMTLFRMFKPGEGDLLMIDCLLGDDPHKRQALTRAVTVTIEGGSLRVATAEDIVLLKLVSARPQDLVDTEAILRLQKGSLDQRYLDEWAERLVVSHTLAGLRAKLA